MPRATEIRELTRVRVLSFLREPEAIFWVFMFPLVLSAVLGFAFRSGGIKPTRIGVVGEGEHAAQLAQSFEVDEHIEIERFESREEALVQLRKAALDAIVEPGDPPGMTTDPSRPEAETARLRVLRVLALSEEDGADAPIAATHLTEKGSRYVDFLFPGLIGMNLMGTGMWGVGFAIADVRRRKFLKRLRVTPMRKSSFILSFMLSRLTFLVLELSVLTVFGAWVLGVPFRGDVLSFAAVSVLAALLFAGLGILIASRVRTIEGVSGLMNLVMMPMWLASGVFFSYERFPDALHPFIRLLPLTAVNDALRAIMLDGASVASLGFELGVMVFWAVATFAVALKIFRWE